ncbi:bifunctional folylpolyglutamate synthase/dihydrofolate synthase [Kocuria coralli]|uniref:Dihydrofolate synthase/folylpolyglutamate synthase n=1 Tax=Kocuria coralli TaxID=1461025 RepID=A0A5J5KZC0_9MICC|nr:folylpolyglutamate synthase/dihydrofolate synthase family protein [Kocuria coralli]KAA9394021.1 bifunctional folylpolyglutamate synthase/dihydrofolate synthase [Kocuria coralli]
MSIDPRELPEAATVEDVYQLLLDRAPENKMAPRLDAMQQAVEILGDPHRSAPVIHITGTNGKTSTARMIEALLLAHDLRVGRYTSPHLERVTERITVDGEEVTEETFVRVFNEIAPYVAVVDARLTEAGAPRLTYFELMTVLAFAVFADAPVDVMVLEVGLGGSWDATNVADAAVSVVTPIDLDHTDLLGDTVEDIAQEKAGIIKPGGFLISAAQDPDAAQVLLERARELGAQFRFEGVEFGVEQRLPGVGGQQITVRGLAGTYEDLLLPVLGEHQASNAALAIAAVEAFVGGGEKPLGQGIVTDGLGAVTSPGRLELMQPSPPVVVDAAHNPHGIAASAAALVETFHPERLYGVLGVLGDKDVDGILQALLDGYAHLDAQWWFTASDSPRALAPETLTRVAVELGFAEGSVHVAETVDDAVAEALEAARTEDAEKGESTVLITGSVTVAGAARRTLRQ